MFLKIQKLTLHQDIKSNWHIQIRSLVCPPWRNKPKQSLHSRLKSQICRRVLHFFGSHRRYNTFRYLKTWFFQGSALKVYLDNDFLSLSRLSEIIIPFSWFNSPQGSSLFSLFRVVIITCWSLLLVPKELPFVLIGDFSLRARLSPTRTRPDAKIKFKLILI